MSWLSKVTDIAGKAEDFLVKLDQNAGDVIQQQKEKTRSQATLPPPSPSPITEEVGFREHSRRSEHVRPTTTQTQPVSGARSEQPHTGSRSLMEHKADKDAQLMELINDEEAFAGSGRSSTHAVTEASDLLVVNNLRSQLSAKDSQITVMKERLMELEKKLDEEAEKAISERGKRESKELMKEKESLLKEVAALKKKHLTLEGESAVLTDQIRLAKFNLAENKREFDEYKLKVQKILQTKESVIESLKSGKVEDGGNVALAELEELRVERDMARADIESLQVQLYNIRAECDEGASTLSEERLRMAELRKTHEEEAQSWRSAMAMMNEKLDCTRLECDFTKQEMERQRKEWMDKLDSAQRELETIRGYKDRRERVHEDHADSSLLLMKKEEELRKMQRENQILHIRLERASHSTSIPMESSSSGTVPPPVQLSLPHSLLLRFLNALRANARARTFFAIYVLSLHVYVFFLVLTYTPEMHSDRFPNP